MTQASRELAWSPQVAEFRDAENSFQHRGNEADGIEELLVWGGTVGNCGESDLSRLVDIHRKTLRSVTYCPVVTKGGALIRPKYHKGSRTEVVTFPELRELCIRAWVPVQPMDYGWETPGLQRLRLVCRHSATTPRMEDLPCPLGLRPWFGVEGPGVRALQLWSRCPQLEAITVEFRLRDGDPRTFVEWVRLVPPRRTPWQVARLLFLPAFASRISVDAAASSQQEPQRMSPLAGLKCELVQQVLSFLWNPRWALQSCQLGELPRFEEWMEH